MKKALFSLLAACLGFQLAAFVPKDAERKKLYREGKKLEKKTFPKPESKSGSPVILLLFGGRPWGANALGQSLMKHGCDVTVLNSVYLAGEGGAPIRYLLYQKEEPKALDAITPEFKHLDDYDMVIVNGIPEANQRNIFTDEKVDQLRKFVSDGGKLLLTINAPADRLSDLMPVEYGKKMPVPEALFARKPDTAAFNIVPKEWQIVDEYRELKLKSNAKSISDIVDADGNVRGIYIATMPYGKGTVVYLNTEKNRLERAQHFNNWAYSSAFVIGLVSEMTGKAMDTSKNIFRGQPTVPPKHIPSENISVPVPAMNLDVKFKAEAKAGNRSVEFADGSRIEVDAGNLVSCYLPGENKPLVRELAVPAVMFSKKQMKIEDSSAEAVGMEDKLDAGKIKWTLDRISGGETAILTWKGDEGTLVDEEIRPSILDLDGKTYRGFAVRAHIRECMNMLSGVGFKYRADVNATKIRRLACYQPPRGYAEYDMTSGKPMDTRQWGFFSDGQPFGWIEGKDGVFATFTGTVQSTNCRISTEKDGALPLVAVNVAFGFEKAPLSTGYIHLMRGPADAADNNGWMAMYQFQRHNLRKDAGIREFPPYPGCAWSNTSTPEQVDRTIANAGKAGLRFVYLPYCPSTINDVDLKGRIDIYRKCREAGLVPYSWNPCGHSPGAGKWFDDQKTWYAYDEKGEPFKYFGGNFPVIDQGSHDFLEWYIPKMTNALKGGLGGVWFDMGGSAVGTRNFARPGSHIGLDNLVKHIYPLFYNNNSWVAVEGQNPLVIDGFWYRANVYTPMSGREFAFVGAMPYGDGFDFDYIRSSMYGTFYALQFNNYGTKFETVPGELKQLADATRYAPTINRALDVAKMPFIRETSSGTSWIGENGGALFFYDAVDNLDVTLPDGCVPTQMIGETGSTLDLGGVMPKSVPQRSIIVFEKRR
ncbi:MAG: hypothetical protein MJ025_02470 [Victivallaceae bacterium]|nr:hypothetical protein [Victivallaceae bacterium]